MQILASNPITSWQIDGGTMEIVRDFVFWGSKIIADSDCIHEIKTHLLLGRKPMTNLDSTLKSRDVSLLTKINRVKAMVFPVVINGCESWTLRSLSAKEDSWEPLEPQGDKSRKSWRKSILNIHWKDWCWSWSWHSNNLASWWEELTSYKRPRFWERWKAGAEKDDREQDGWMTSPTQWTWVWARSGRWWRIGKPGVLQSMGLQRVGHDWVTEQINKPAFCSFPLCYDSQQPQFDHVGTGKLYHPM